MKDIHRQRDIFAANIKDAVRQLQEAEEAGDAQRVLSSRDYLRRALAALAANAGLRKGAES